MIKQLLNSVIAKYRDLAASRRSIDLLATDKSRYFAQPRPIIELWDMRKWRIGYAITRPLSKGRQTQRFSAIQRSKKC